MLPRDFFTCIDIYKFPRTALSGSKVDGIYGLISTPTARSLRQVNPSFSSLLFVLEEGAIRDAWFKKLLKREVFV